MVTSNFKALRAVKDTLNKLLIILYLKTIVYCNKELSSDATDRILN